MCSSPAGNAGLGGPTLERQRCGPHTDLHARARHGDAHCARDAASASPQPERGQCRRGAPVRRPQPLDCRRGGGRRREVEAAKLQALLSEGEEGAEDGDAV